MIKIGTVISYNHTPDVFNFVFQLGKDSVVRNYDFIFVKQDQDRILGKIVNLTSTNDMFSDPGNIAVESKRTYSPSQSPFS